MSAAVDPWASVRGPIVERPFDLAPLLEASKAGSLCQFAMRVGSRQSAVSRAAVLGVTDEQADRWAVALGFHPSELYGDLWWSLAPEEDA